MSDSDRRQRQADDEDSLLVSLSISYLGGHLMTPRHSSEWPNLRHKVVV